MTDLRNEVNVNDAKHYPNLKLDNILFNNTKKFELNKIFFQTFLKFFLKVPAEVWMFEPLTIA